MKTARRSHGLWSKFSPFPKILTPANDVLFRDLRPFVAEERNLILDQLRQRTRLWHQRVESRLDLTRPDLTLDRYQQWLWRFFTFYRPLENQIFDEHRDWAKQLGLTGREKCAWLIADLMSLGAAQSDIDRARDCLMVPAVQSPAQLLGCLYVMEGSTLGGQFICRHVSSNLGLTPSRGLAFFNSYGSEVGEKWAAFRKTLVAASSPQDDETMMQAALRTFATLDGWFAEPDWMIPVRETSTILAPSPV